MRLWWGMKRTECLWIRMVAVILSMCCCSFSPARYIFHQGKVNVPSLNISQSHTIIQTIWHVSYSKTIKKLSSIQFCPCLKIESNLRSEKWRKLSVFFAKNRAKVKTYHFFAKKHPKMTKSYCKKSENVNFYALPIVKNTSFYTPFWPFTRKSIKPVLMGGGNFRNPFVHLRGFWKARFCIFEIFKISKNCQIPPPF